MDHRHRQSHTRFLLFVPAAAMLVTMCGCADMLPNSETWEKWSPSNIWYRMQPTQLSRLNEGNGLTPDAYYSISDFPERDRSVVEPIQLADGAATTIKPIESGTAFRP
jgi:hypothetical protein